jgi:hypothetical protein
MKPAIIILLICTTLFSCQKKESVLNTEKNALNAVFNQVVDSVYLKSTENKTIPDNAKKKTLVIYDSLMAEMPSIFHLQARFKTIKNTYTDTISQKIRSKINLPLLEKKANFKYNYSLSFYKDEPFPAEFWNSNFALPGFILFSKINFDEERKYGVFYVTYTNGNYLNAKYFLVYIEKMNDIWKLNQVDVMYRTY